MKIVTIVGARPQFIKAAPVSWSLRESGHVEILIHTGQHYDHEMSRIFFDEMNIPQPDKNLAVGSGSHALQTGQMMLGVEEVLLAEKPDFLLVYGDTNSTIAGALAACKINVPIAHVEAGLRSFNREMPEEHNRVLTDHCSNILLCPTQTAVENLQREGITAGVANVGDTMYDAALKFAQTAERYSDFLQELAVEKKKYLLATVHRNYNTDNNENLKNILTALGRLEQPVVFPLHPRTRKKIEELFGQGKFSKDFPNVKCISPVGYLQMLMLEANAKMILTDSGGVQKEAFFVKVPCVTLRTETEWVETVEVGWNYVSGVDPQRIVEAVSKRVWPEKQISQPFGDGQAAKKIVETLAAAGNAK